MAFITEEWDQEIVAALEDYCLTDAIGDLLLTGFNQRGRWIGLATGGIGAFDEILILKLSKERISSKRLIRDNVDGERTLFGSFVSESAGKVTIDFLHVRGRVIANSTRAFDAPNLKSVGGDLTAVNAGDVRIPKLESVGHSFIPYSAQSFQAPCLKVVGASIFAPNVNDFNVPTLNSVGGEIGVGTATKFHAPCLESVGEGLHAYSATTFYAPKLISVGGDLITQYAEDFYPINIKVAGEWKMNPEARTLRLEKHAREIQRQGETFEL